MFSDNWVNQIVGAARNRMFKAALSDDIKTRDQSVVLLAKLISEATRVEKINVARHEDTKNFLIYLYTKLSPIGEPA